MLMRIELSKAPKKPLTEKLGTRAAASQSIKALTTKVKSPKVRILMGKVRTIITGRKMAFMIARTRAAITAVPIPLI
jgi:hypothetical protein